MSGELGNTGLPGINVNGERWFPSERNFADSMPDYWGDWYCDSECGTLRSVLMHRPGPELDAVKDPREVRFKASIDPDKARAEHDALADFYRQHGITVHYVEGFRVDRPNAMFMRDQVLMTPEGAIICRPGMEARRGEERHAAEALARLGVPILTTVHGDGVFEGACAMWVDRESIIIGTGSRANVQGTEQVEWVLRNIGVKNILRFQIPYGHAHLDGLMNIPDRRKIMLFPWQVSYDLVKPLLDMGFTVLENPFIEEIKGSFAVNFVAIAPGKIVMPAGNPRSKKILEDAGVECIEIQLPEIMKGWGAIHCLTAFLKRDPV